MRLLDGSMNGLLDRGSMNGSLDGSMNGWSERIDELEGSSGRIDELTFGKSVSKVRRFAEWIDERIFGSNRWMDFREGSLN